MENIKDLHLIPSLRELMKLHFSERKEKKDFEIRLMHFGSKHRGLKDNYYKFYQFVCIKLEQATKEKSCITSTFRVFEYLNKSGGTVCTVRFDGRNFNEFDVIDKARFVISMKMTLSDNDRIDDLFFNHQQSMWDKTVEQWRFSRKNYNRCALRARFKNNIDSVPLYC